MRRGVLEENGIYHVYNRGADKRKIFMDEKDYLRFVHDLFEFNDEDDVRNMTYEFMKNPVRVAGIEFRDRECEKPRKKRKILVDVLSFTLMPNHFHLLLRQRKENSITQFMQKMGAGYALYFNQKYGRSGVLFQGRFKAVQVKSNRHLLHVPHYIHANPLDLKDGDRDDIKFLNSYRWSSHMDYCGWRNFPSVTHREFLLDLFGGEESYKKSIAEWVKEREKNINKMKEVSIDGLILLLVFLQIGSGLLSFD